MGLSIDREKVIKATELLDDFFNEYREVYYISPHEAWEIIKDTLKEQEAKTGHWIDTTKVFGFPRVQCSVCGSEQGAVWMYYCPICGAKMSPLALPASGG